MPAFPVRSLARGKRLARLSTLVAPAALALVALGAPPSHAESFASSASSAGSASLGSLSDSLRGSSNSSSGDRHAAAGDYRVIAVGVDPDRPGTRRYTLVPVEGSAAGGFELRVPDAALGDRPIAVDDIVQAQTRPYGLAFARGAAPGGGAVAQPFFLVLADDWHGALDPRAVSL